MNRDLSMSGLYNKVYAQLEQRGNDDSTEDEWVYYHLVDVFSDNDGSLYAIISHDGGLYRSYIAVNDQEEVMLGDFVSVTQEFAPITRTVVSRANDGRWRWFSISSSATFNRVRAIDSTELYEDMERRFHALLEAHATDPEANPLPRRNLYHDGDKSAETGTVDFVGREGYTLITSGVWDDTLIAEIERKAIQNNPNYYGESIEFFALQPPSIEVYRSEDGVEIEIPVYRVGEFVGVASCPQGHAASLNTGVVVKEERMNTHTQEYLKKLAEDAGMEDQLDAILARADGVNRGIADGLADGSVIARADHVDQEHGDQAVTSADEVIDNIEEFGREIDTALDAVANRQIVDDLQAQIERLSASIAGLEKKIDEVERRSRDETTEAFEKINASLVALRTQFRTVIADAVSTARQQIRDEMSPSPSGRGIVPRVEYGNGEDEQSNKPSSNDIINSRHG